MCTPTQDFSGLDDLVDFSGSYQGGNLEFGQQAVRQAQLEMMADAGNEFAMHALGRPVAGAVDTGGGPIEFVATRGSGFVARSAGRAGLTAAVTISEHAAERMAEYGVTCRTDTFSPPTMTTKTQIIDAIRAVQRAQLGRKRLVNILERLIADCPALPFSEEVNSRLRDLAFDLSFYEPNKRRRDGDSSFFGDGRLQEEIVEVLNVITVAEKASATKVLGAS